MDGERRGEGKKWQRGRARDTKGVFSNFGPGLSP